MSEDQYKRLLMAAVGEIKSYKAELQQLKRENAALERQIEFYKKELGR
jgi:cell division protein FtsB